jgi:pyruvate dehydrogenase E2 component (dihydrolipoamide acetyltransferase)
MATEVILPRVDMDMAAGRVSRWYVEEGEAVEQGQPLFEIETDKAAMEIEAPASGVLRAVSAAPGVAVPVGATIAWIAAPGEAIAPAAEPAAAAVPEGDAAPAPEPASAPEATEASTTPRATPLARRLARERGIDLAALNGSGPRGRIVAKDVPDAARPAAPVTVAPGGTLHRAWLRQGEGDPLVLLHGFGADLDAWRGVLAGWSPGRPVLALDLPGHGRSALDGELSLDGLALAVEAALAEEGVGALHLVGHSLGGAVAATVAGIAAREIRSLVLLAPAGLGPEINGDAIGGLARSRTEASLAAWLGECVADHAVLMPAFIKATARSRADGARAVLLQRLAAALFPDGTQAFSIRPVLSRLAMPTKIVFGAEDRIIPARQARGLPGAIALHVFAGVGHLPQIETREAVTRLLVEAMRSVG